MPIRAECPHCLSPLSAPDKLAGKIISCPKCQGKMMLPDDEDEPAPPPPPPPPARLPVATLVPPPPTRAEPDDDDDDQPRPRRRRPPPPPPNNTWKVVAASVGGVALTLLIVTANVMRGVNRAEQREQARQQAPPQGPAVGPAIGAPVVPNIVPEPAAPAPVAGGPSDLPGESVVAEAGADATAPLRPRPGDPLYQLSNLRSAPGMGFNSTTYKFDYRRVRAGASNALPTVYFRVDGGRPQSVMSFPRIGFGPPPESDTIEVNLRTIGFGPRFGRDTEPSKVEFYLGSGGWVPTIKTFKASNSVVLNGAAPTLAREWSAQEAEIVRAGKDKENPNPPPPPPANASQKPDYAGAESGAEARKTGPGDMVGFDVKLNAAGDRFAELEPVFDRDAPARPGFQRVVGGQGTQPNATFVYLNKDGFPRAMTVHFGTIPGATRGGGGSPVASAGSADGATPKVLTSHWVKLRGIAVRSDAGGVTGFGLISEEK